MSMLPPSRHFVLAIAIACAGCAGPLNPEAGFSVPKDPGTVVGRVSDQDAAPVRDAKVQVHDIPSDVGSFYSVGQWTDASGVTTIHGKYQLWAGSTGGCVGQYSVEVKSVSK